MAITAVIGGFLVNKIFLITCFSNPATHGDNVKFAFIHLSAPLGHTLR